MAIDISSLIKGARQRQGLTQTELAEKAGVSQQTIAKLESGVSVRSRHLPEIAAALGTSVEAMLRGMPAPQGQTSTSPGEIEQSILVYPTQMGAEGQFVRMSETIGIIAVPEPLRLGGGFGLYLSEEEMIPVYEPGDVAFAHLSLPPLTGTDCIFLGIPNEVQEQRVVVRRLLQQTTKDWIVQAWNPAASGIKLSRTEWPKALRVMGKFNRR